MGKKHWIYIKRGLSEDAKHRAAMGECIWLYMHIIDRADWETGIAFDWKDKEEAADMSMPVDTLRRQRQKLEELDYIRTKQKQHSQDIFIIEWKNPRDYGSEVKNPRSEGSHGSLPSNSEGLNQGSNQGLNEGQAQVKTPTSTSESETPPVSFTEEEQEQMKRKVYAIIGQADDARQSWDGRDMFRDNHLAYADWYHGSTGQVCKKKKVSSWQKAFSNWQDERLTVSDLQAAYNVDIVWRKVFTDPNELTAKAVALKAATSAPSAEPVRPEHKKYVPPQGNFIPCPANLPKPTFPR